ncbi:uncharacterized protein FRV6_00946 [Fusarium oxysporum]|uniref:Uncharacterized protein n=1 Tax=Fusarium oxysporum TaxID=5507 RepID=A0A2H3SWA9_FUSOX|nr:uncharacterized protein FRV6_00946 [Fusarium oxysporum]
MSSEKNDAYSVEHDEQPHLQVPIMSAGVKQPIKLLWCIRADDLLHQNWP